EETGPTSCPGTNDTSLTNASALWAADYTLYAATLGVERMAMHSMLGACKGGAPMSLICDPADRGEQSKEFQVRPNLLALRVRVPPAAVTGGGHLSAATVRKDGARARRTAVISANDAARVGGTRLAVATPSGVGASPAPEVYGESSDVKRDTEVGPASPRPDD